jgi:two-component system nitrate/nitrite response regulator NarL
MFASSRTLLDTLQLIVCEHLRVFMVNETIALDVLIDPEQADEAMQDHSLAASLASSLQVPVPGMPCARGLLAKDAGDMVVQIGGVPGLSEREEQILKALVRGYSNKMIARMYSVTEATVKVHMKSILRKIRVVNRTQAAIWALRNAYSSEDVNEERPGKPKDIQDVPLVNGHRC